MHKQVQITLLTADAAVNKLEKVRIENGYTREEFGMLSQTKIEDLLHDPLLVKFMINDDRSMTLKEVEEAIKGWKK